MSADETRKRILDSALALFSQKGFTGAATRDIARRAGVAEVTLFRHFVSKEALFKAVIGRYSFLPALEELLPQFDHLTYDNALREIASQFLTLMEERRDFVRMMLAERHLYPAPVREIFRGYLSEIFRMLADYFRRLQARGVLRDFDADICAKAFFGALFARVHFTGFFFEEDRRSASSKRTLDEITALFVNGTVLPAGGRRSFEKTSVRRKRSGGNR